MDMDRLKRISNGARAYLISNGEVIYDKVFDSIDDAKHWVINTLDISKLWTIKKK